MEFEAYHEHIDTHGGNRYDTSRLLHEHATRSAVITDLVEPFTDKSVDTVAGIDALGFAFGVGVADTLEVDFLPIRKGGKLPIPDDHRRREALTDYSDEKKDLEIDATAISDGARVIAVDDWVETGAQMTAATRLVEAAGGMVVGIAVLDAEVNDTTCRLAERYDVHTVNPETRLA